MLCYVWSILSRETLQNIFLPLEQGFQITRNLSWLPMAGNDFRKTIFHHASCDKILSKVSRYAFKLREGCGSVYLWLDTSRNLNKSL